MTRGWKKDGFVQISWFPDKPLLVEFCHGFSNGAKYFQVIRSIRCIVPNCCFDRGARGCDN